jgi:molecular chaperone GrpE
MRDEKDTQEEVTEVDIDSDDEVDEEVVELTTCNEIEMELEAQRVRADETFEKMQRLQAEYENYRKRMNTRLEEISKFAGEGLLLKILEVYDNIERAMAVDFSVDPKAAQEGINAIQMQMEKILTQEGIRPIESLNMTFDPYYQNAVGTIHDEGKPNNTVVEEYLKGYMIREKVLRHAMVLVNRHQAPTIQDEGIGDSSSNNESGQGE